MGFKTSKKMSECVVVGCRKVVCVNKNGEKSSKCQHHKDLHAAQNRLSYLKAQQSKQEMMERAKAYDGLVSTINTLTDELRAARAENDKLRHRSHK